MASIEALSDIPCASDQAVWPWQAEPYRLWSLLDMLRFYGATFVTIVTRLERARALLSGLQNEDEAVRTFVGEMEDLVREVDKVPFSQSLHEQVRRLQRYATERTFEPNYLVFFSGEILANIQLELTEHLFLCVPAANKWLFLEPEKWFGPEIINQFGVARDDARECGQCLALERGSAAVFHAMGMMEHGLRVLAKKLDVEFALPIELENWKNIIDSIEKKIRRMEQEPKSQKKSDDMQFYSAVASHFWYVKEAWRNHVSHGRGRYAPEEARRIVEHVRDMMRHIAIRLSSESA